MLSRASAEEDWFIDVYNASIPMRIRVQRTGSSEFLGREDLVANTIILRDPAGAVIPEADYTVNLSTGVLTWVTLHDVEYYQAEYKYWIKGLVESVASSLLPVYVKPVFNWLSPTTPLFPSSEWGLAIWGESTWGGPQ